MGVFGEDYLEGGALTSTGRIPSIPRSWVLRQTGEWRDRHRHSPFFDLHRRDRGGPMALPSLLDGLCLQNLQPKCALLLQAALCGCLVTAKVPVMPWTPVKAHPEIIYPDPCCLLSFLCLQFSCFQQAAALASERKVFSFPRNFILLFN